MAATALGAAAAFAVIQQPATTTTTPAAPVVFGVLGRYGVGNVLP